NVTLESMNTLNDVGWKLGIYPLARKSCDAFANLKSANYLTYVLADLYAKENGLDESLVMNSNNKIADGSKTNLFIIKGDELFTPALHQGCVNGVMRHFVIEQCKQNNFVVHQTEVDVSMLRNADEIFLTNALQGIRWVASFGEDNYRNTITSTIYSMLFSNDEKRINY
ncbi:MAG TPA: aminotransferase class IV, partial [Chitinophagaceae bacterium]|nr:aminotransferase class IV [Chitinophagaceae bacterium]